MVVKQSHLPLMSQRQLLKLATDLAVAIRLGRLQRVLMRLAEVRDTLPKTKKLIELEMKLQQELQFIQKRQVFIDQMLDEFEILLELDGE